MSEIFERSPQEQISLMQTHYYASMNCWNCNAHNGDDIRKGTPKLGHVIPCHKCGCPIDLGKGKP